MDFGFVLRRSWELIWKNKVLWIFGILASCSTGGANFGGGFNGQMGSGDTQFRPEQFEQWSHDFETFVNQGGWAIIFAVFCAVILIGLLFWVIGIFGKVGLIKGILKADAGSALSFRPLASESWGMLGSALGLNLVLILIPLAALFVGILFSLLTFGIGLICLVCLGIPLAIAYSVYTELANVALVREQRGVGAALSSAWELIRTQFAPLAGMAVVLIVGGFVVGLILLLPFAAVALPAILSFARDPNTVGGGLLISGILFLILLPFYFIATGIIQSYLHSAWTLTFLQLTPSAPAKSTRAKAKK